MFTKDNIFSVTSRPLTTYDASGTPIKIPNKKAILVDNEHVASIMSNKYRIHQPSEIMESFDNVAEKCNLKVTQTLANPLNGSLLLEAEYETTSFLKEEHSIRVSLFTSHCGRYRTILALFALRHACFNQVPVLTREKDNHLFSEKHYARSLNIENFEKILAGIPAAVQNYNSIAEQLNDKKLSYADFVEFYIEHYNLNRDSSHFDNKIENLRQVYYKADGQSIIANDNAYKAMQAVTYLNTHEIRDSAFKVESQFHRKSKDSIAVMQGLLAA